MTPGEWLARVRHDLVKRLVWPARDRRDMGGNPAPGELVPDLIDDEGRPITAPQAGDVAGVIALEAAFAALARSLEGQT